MYSQFHSRQVKTVLPHTDNKERTILPGLLKKVLFKLT